MCYLSCIEMLEKGVAIDEKTLGDFLSQRDVLLRLKVEEDISSMVSKATHLHIEHYARVV